jgi:hypothetical protein
MLLFNGDHYTQENEKVASDNLVQTNDILELKRKINLAESGKG